MNLKKINSNTKWLSIILKNKFISTIRVFISFHVFFSNPIVYVDKTKGRISPDSVVSWNKRRHEIFHTSYRNDNQKKIIQKCNFLN